MSGNPPPSVAFVTVSYGPDRDRCALLTESLAAFAPTYDHWIVVDRADLPQFRSLARGRTTVTTTEEVLPVWIRRLNLRRIGLRSNVWVTGRGRPVRGWLVQQLVKLAVAESVATDVVVHSDSDVVLVRPFRPDALVDDEGRVRLVAVPDAIDASLEKHVAWQRTAERLLGIPPAELPMTDFITSLVPWKQENAVRLLRHVEERAGATWVRAVAGAWDVSEYILYGRFVTDVLGDDAGQFTSAASLCHDYWTHAPLAPAELEAFLDGIGPEQVAVSITAKAGMQPSEYHRALQRLWAANA